MYDTGYHRPGNIKTANPKKNPRLVGWEAVIIDGAYAASCEGRELLR